MRKQLAGLTLICLSLLIVLIAACCPSIQKRDISQERLDTALPPLAADHLAGQTFVSRRPNLCSVEVLLVRYGPEKSRTPGTSHIVFYLKEVDVDDQDPVRQVVDTSGYEHNSPMTFSFAPQPDSQGKRYSLSLEGLAGDDLSVWYSSEDAYGQGEMLLDGQLQRGDLRFVTQYAYDLRLALHDLGELARRYAWPTVLTLVVLLVPGWFVRTVLDLQKGCDPFAGLSQTVAMSLAVMPIVLLWTTMSSVRFSRHGVIAGLAALACVAGWVSLRRGGSSLRRRLSLDSHLGWCVAVPAFALLLAVRFLQIGDVALPLWVDSLHHTMITRLIADRGMIPQTYEPYVPVASTIYHFGFHADAAFYQFLSGLSSERVLLILGQVLNALCSGAAYLLAVRFTRSRLAGFFAFVVVGFVSVMPAYYVSWGRYTQLTGLIILPGFMVTFADGIEAPQNRWRPIIAGALLLAGLVLTHYRVAIIGVCFALVWTCGALWRTRRIARARSEVVLRAGCILVGALLVALPWIRDFVQAFVVPFGPLVPRLQGSTEARELPWQLLNSGHDRLLMILALVGAALGVARRKRGLTALLTWIALLIVIVNPHLFGLEDTWLITNFSIAIALFLPLGVFVGNLCSEAARVLRSLLAWGQKRPPPIRNVRPGTDRRSAWTGLRETGRRLWTDDAPLTRKRKNAYYALVIGAAFALALCGGWNSLDVVNPATILATEQDVEAMDWIRGNTAPDARFLVNSRWWQYDMRMGTDAGWWIPLLTGRQATQPPVLYSMADPDYVARVNHLGEMVEDSTSLDDPAVQELLDEAAVTHVYIGAKGGHLTPKMLLASGGFRPIYSSGEVWIFAREP